MNVPQTQSEWEGWFQKSPRASRLDDSTRGNTGTMTGIITMIDDMLTPTAPLVESNNLTDISPANDTGMIADNEDMSTETFDAEPADVLKSMEIMESEVNASDVSMVAPPDYLEDTLKELPAMLLETVGNPVEEISSKVFHDEVPYDEFSHDEVSHDEVSHDLESPADLNIFEIVSSGSSSQVRAIASQVAICSQTNGRANNEDSYFVQLLPTLPGTDPVLLLTLSDGMGGHDFGELASRETLRKLALLLFEQYAVLPQLNGNGNAPTVEAVGQAIVQAIPLVSAHIQRIAEINGWNRSGATLVVVAIVGDEAIFVNVGDSPAYHVVPSENHVSYMTADHSLAGMLLKANLITPEMARVHEGRSQLEHYIGGTNLPNEMPVRKVTLHPGEFILLCSDGVSNSLTDSDILRLLEENKENLTQTAANFVVHARQSGERDNQTIVLYQHGQEPRLAGIEVIPDGGPLAPYSADYADDIPVKPETTEEQS